MIAILKGVARHGRIVLIAGLAAGVLMPELALGLRGWIPHMVAVLLFLTAFRIGFSGTMENLQALRRTIVAVLLLQLAAPVVFLGLVLGLGLPVTPLLLAVALVLAAPSVTGAANFAILLGHAPAPALRLLILGTALLPVTCIPVLWLLPQFAALDSILLAALRLLAVILTAAAVGFALRRWAFGGLSDAGQKATDGLTVIVLAVIVVALMSAIQPAFLADPLNLFFWLCAAFALNFGAQIVVFHILRRSGHQNPVPTAIVAGNRNFALFFVALAPEATEPLLIFLGCYQFPMYLTPTLLRRLYEPA